MELGTIIDALYACEISCLVSTFWDGGYTVRLGDEMNGLVAETDCKSAAQAAEFLDRAACEHYPESKYALGKEEWERCNQAQKGRHTNN